jgi:hypothetical protein
VGKGVFANRSFKPQQEVGRIRGKLIEDPTYGSTYCMDFGEGRLIEPTAPFRYLNHSCEPNCELIIWVDEDSAETLRLALHAVTAIQSGEELTIDYGWCADAAVPCQCGCPACRGWIVAPDELPLVLERLGETEVPAGK